jgi:hypothetical protein
MRKAQDDPIARTVAENQLGDMFAGNGRSVGDRDSDVSAARGLLGAFKAVEFETTSRNVGDQVIPLRRLIITGPWEVDPGGK